MAALGAAHELDTVHAGALQAAGTPEVGLLTESAGVGSLGAEHGRVPWPTKVVVDLGLEGEVVFAGCEGGTGAALRVVIGGGQGKAGHEKADNCEHAVKMDPQVMPFLAILPAYKGSLRCFFFVFHLGMQTL